MTVGHPARIGRHLLVQLPTDELPQWLGDALAGLAGDAGWVVEVQRGPAVQSRDRDVSDAVDRWWRARLSGLAPWRDRRGAGDLWSSHGTGAADPDVVLVLDADATVSRACDSVLLLCDGTGRGLSMRYPLLDDICSGRGLRLQLMARRPDSSRWRLLRRMHRASSPRYRRGLDELSRAVGDLIRQSVAGGRALSSTAAALSPVPRRSLPRPVAEEQRGAAAVWKAAGGRWRAWLNHQRSLWLSEYWRVGIIDAPVATLLQSEPLPAPRWITRPPRSAYWADPFGLPGDSHRLLCELFDERTGVGHLEMLELDAVGDIAVRTRLAVGDGRHLSFPNVFEMDGRQLAVAESVASRECVLHEVDAAGVWRPVHTLLQGVAAADPALFKWEGRYWLAFTDADLGEMDNLCLFHAERIEGPWRPHARNPVKVDVRSARMAGGVFRHEGELYRPAQDCLRTYGAAVVVHRIVHLSPDHFEEVRVRRLEPDPKGVCPDGLHTVTAWGDRMLIDGKRHGFNAFTLWRKLRRRGLLRRRPFMPSWLPTEPAQQRVMIYLPYLEQGGAEISLLRVAQGLVQAGLRVEIVVHSFKLQDLGVPPGVEVVSLGRDGTAAALWALRRHIRTSQPHWVISAFPHNNVAAVLATALSGSAARCVVTEHAPLSHQIEREGHWRFRILPPLVRWAYRRAHAVVAVSAGVRDDLQALIGTGVAPMVIHNPVLADDFEREVATAPEHRWLVDESLEVVLSVARLNPEKDLQTLVRAFDRLRKLRPTARLLLIGEGPARASLQALVNQLGLQALVELPGRTHHPLRSMGRAAVFALTSVFEGFGNVLVEALAAGAPVVSTDCPVGPREILADGSLGDLVPVGDDTRLAAALLAALERGRVQPEGARESALRYTQAASCGAYQRLLEALYPVDKRAC